MRIKVRGYNGILIELDSCCDILRNVRGERVRVIHYCVTIACDDGATVKIDRVKSSEIEVVNDEH